MYGNKNCFVFLHIVTVSKKISNNFYIRDYKGTVDWRPGLIGSTLPLKEVQYYYDFTYCMCVLYLMSLPSFISFRLSYSIILK